MENIEVPQNLEMEYYAQPSNSNSGYLPKEYENNNSKRYTSMHSYVNSALFTTAKIWKHTRRLLID